MFVVNATTT